VIIITSKRQLCWIVTWSIATRTVYAVSTV